MAKGMKRPTVFYILIKQAIVEITIIIFYILNKKIPY